MDKILIVIGDAAEAMDTLYPTIVSRRKGSNQWWRLRKSGATISSYMRFRRGGR